MTTEADLQRYLNGLVVFLGLVVLLAEDKASSNSFSV